MTKPSYHLILLGIILQCFIVEFLQAQEFSKHPSETEYFYHDVHGNRSGLSFPYAVKLVDRLMWFVRNSDGYGIVNEEGEVVLEPQYDYIGSFRNDLAIVIDEGYFGVIDDEGSMVLDVFHDAIYSISDDSIYLKLDGLWMAYINNEYTPIDSTSFEYLKTDRPARLEGCGDLDMANCRNYYHTLAQRGQQYPKYARENGYEGSVIVELTIDKMGSIIEEEVIQSVGGGCDKEALRCVRQNVPHWLPALESGLPVQSKVQLLFGFRLK